MDIQGLKKKDKEEKIDEILKQMNLSDVKYKFPHELSGGMRQRISFARTILTGSDLLLFDEPLSALDYITRIYMQQWLSETLLSYHDKTAVFITHDIDEAIFLSDEILVVKDTPITCFEKIYVNLPKIRTRQMLEKKEIIDMKNHILSLLAVKI
jgi:taurine ABC superfamily ATP binding cassette transporter, ABC protein